jgi:predicted HTH domain antitoxin
MKHRRLTLKVTTGGVVMRMTSIQFEIPEDILYSLNENTAEFTQRMRLYSALQLFKDHKLSLGKAAELAGIKKEHFMFELDRYEIPLIDYDPDELDQEAAAFGS